MVVATNPAPENATHHRRPMEAATAVVLTLTSDLVAVQSALNLEVKKYDNEITIFVQYTFQYWSP